MASPTFNSNILDNEIQVSTRTLLIADADQLTLNILPRIVSERLPDVAINICTSAAQLCRMLKHASYDVITMSPVLMRDVRILQHFSVHQLLAPKIVTAGLEDRPLAESILRAEAFDLIAKPIVPHRAVQSVRLALWQNKLLRLLASRERASIRFEEHMKAFPHALKMKQAFVSKMIAYERTMHALTTSMQRLLNIDEERSAFDMAALVERLTKERALDRLFNLCRKGLTQ